jgi:hypothetical protein
MDESMLHGSDPETSIAVSEDSICIDITVPQWAIRMTGASNRVRFEFVARELQESTLVDGN